MSKHRPKSKENSQSILQRNTQARQAGIILLMVVTAVLVVVFWKSQQTTPGLRESAPVSAEAANVPPSATAEVSPEFQRLRGRWLRPDGGYIIEIRDVDAAGQLDATYANPKPIHVAEAQATRDGKQTKVFIELRDVNYPGSTYTLAYLPDHDQLSGIYYQALQGQRFKVMFVRLK